MSRRAAVAVAILLWGGGGASKSSAENIVFPPDAGLVNVKTEYGAKGDGRTDDTLSLQRAIDENKGSNVTLYLPNGTYLLTDSLGIFGGKAHSRDRFLHYQGQSEAGTVLKLRDHSPGFGDPNHEKIVLSYYQGESTGDVMHSYVRNLTVDVGVGNPGAVGLRFLSNNTGAVYHVTIRSSDPDRRGKLGLDMRQSQNGPCLVKHVTVVGFDRGVETGNSFSLVFEHLTLKGQRVVGFYNNMARTTLRGLVSDNAVPALRCSEKGAPQLTLVDGTFTGGAPDAAAVELTNTKVFLRDLHQEGYGHLLRRGDETVDGTDLREWHGSPGKTLFASGDPTSLRLPIKETPEIPWETDLSKWVKVDHAAPDDSEAVQSAFDRAAAEGKTTVYFPKHREFKQPYLLSRTIRVHGSVQRIIGMENMIKVADPDGKLEAGGVLFRFEDLTSEAVIFERFFNFTVEGGWKGLYGMSLFQNNSGKAVVVANLAHGAGSHCKPGTGGEWFFEDFAGGKGVHIGPGERCWSRQHNGESPDKDLLTVDGGQMWILGLKTEGRTRHLIVRNGAQVELLGGVSYQSWKDQPLDPPLFTVQDAQASFTFGFYHWNQPFTTIVEETRAGVTRTLPRAALDKYHLPLYRSGGRK